MRYTKVNIKPYKTLNLYPVYIEDVYNGHEPFKVVGIRENQVELEGDYSGVGLDKSKQWFDDDKVFVVKTVCEEHLKPNGCQVHNVNCCGGGSIINKHIRWWDDTDKLKNKKSEIITFSVGDVKGILPTNEEIDKIIEENIINSLEIKKYNEKEQLLMLAAMKAGAKWFRSSLIEGKFIN